MQEEYTEAQSYILHYTSQSSLDYLDRDQKWYDEKISMFELFLKTHLSLDADDATSK